MLHYKVLDRFEIELKHGVRCVKPILTMLRYFGKRVAIVSSLKFNELFELLHISSISIGS